MKKLPKLLKLSIVFFISFSCIFLLVRKANAASFSSAKDVISTSRPSAAAPLAANVAAGATLFTFDNNGSRFLASDSAIFWPDTGETLESKTVASMSGNTVYLAQATSNTHHKGAAVIVPVTATHTITFRTVTAVPSGGFIKIIFPVGNTSNPASPSASGFSFNGLASGNISISGTSCGSWTITPASGLVQCTLSSAISSPTTITVTLGSSTPALINPTKAAAAGTADTWSINIQTTDSGGTILDQSRIKVGTVESVEVYATVDPTFTFSIAGINNGQAINTGNTTGCTNTETVNTGFNSTATEVNLGVLGPGVINIGAQLLTITTNGINGYTLTATSSGFLINPDMGYWIPNAQGVPSGNDTPAPVALTAGTPAFGIHPCGLDVNTSTWGSGTTGGGTGAKYANPSPVYYYTLASDTTGPVGNSITAGNGLVSVEYAATMSVAVPAGVYRTAMTYVATPAF